MPATLHERKQRPILRRICWGLLALFSSVIGCQQTTYKPATIPTDYVAQPVVSVKKLDLSRINRAEVSHQEILPGDLLDVSIATGLEVAREPTSWVLQVAENGTVEVPLVGTVTVAEMDPQLARTAIYQASVNRGIYRNPNVSVAIKKRQTITVTVMGAVEKPGQVELVKADSHLLSAIVQAGGLSEDALPEVEIRHPLRFDQPSMPIAEIPGENPTQQMSFQQSPSPRVIPVNLQEASKTGVGDFHLEDGSVVMVHRKEQDSIYVMGLVKKPSSFELPLNQEMRLLDAIAMSGGRKWEVADKVTVIRKHPSGEGQIQISCSVYQAKRDATANLLLAPGDMISVDETPVTATLDALDRMVRFSLPLTSFLF